MKRKEAIEVTKLRVLQRLKTEWGRRRKSLPVVVAVDAHGVVAVGEDHLGAGLHADAALVLPLRLFVRRRHRRPPPPLPAPPLRLLQLLRRAAALQLLQRRVQRA